MAKEKTDTRIMKELTPEERRDRFLELMKDGVEYDLEALKALARERLEGEGIFAVLDYEFSELIMELLEQGKLEGAKHDRFAYQELGDRYNSMIIASGKLISVKKVL